MANSWIRPIVIPRSWDGTRLRLASLFTFGEVGAGGEEELSDATYMQDQTLQDWPTAALKPWGRPVNDRGIPVTEEVARATGHPCLEIIFDRQPNPEDPQQQSRFWYASLVPQAGWNQERASEAWKAL